MTHPSPFEPGTIGPLTLRNRVIKTATYEGMSPGGVISQDLIDHHARLAQGGVALCTVAYCCVHADGRTFTDQLVMDESRLEPLKRLTDAVHAAGGRASAQLGHAGFFTKNGELSTTFARGPSWTFNAYGVMVGKPIAKPMSEAEIAAIVEQFADAAALAERAGFDAVEVHAGHGYLLSQFISPATNRRTDGYGGDVNGRARFAYEVVRAVRERVGDRLAVLVKVNLHDGFDNGLSTDDACEVARGLQSAGAHALVMSGGFTSRSAFYLMRGGLPLKRMVEVEKSPAQRVAMRLFGKYLVKAFDFEEMFFLEKALQMREAVDLPLVLLGGILSRENLEHAMASGFEFVAVGRALIADPDWVNELESGAKQRSRCISCNACVPEMDVGGIRCVLDDEPTRLTP